MVTRKENPPLAMSELRNHRMRLGLSQSEAARRLGLSEAAVNRHERGNRRPDLRTLQQYAELYGVTLFDLHVDLGD